MKWGGSFNPSIAVIAAEMAKGHFTKRTFVTLDVGKASPGLTNYLVTIKTGFGDHLTIRDRDKLLSIG